VDIIVVSILSTLTSSPLVIQQQVKALHHRGSSGCPHVYAESELEPNFHFAPFIIIQLVGCPTLFILFHRELSNFSCHKAVDPGITVAVGIIILCMEVIVFSFVMLGIWLFRYFRYLASLFFSVFPKALGATGEGQLNSGTVEFTKDVIDIDFALSDPNEDLMVQFVSYIRLDPSWWEKAQRQFNLESNISEDEYALWLVREDMPGGMNNLLELIQWFYSEVEK